MTGQLSMGKRQSIVRAEGLLSRPPRPPLRAAIALLLLTSAASIGILARSHLQGSGGQVIFIATRVWMLALPVLWYWRTEKSPISFTKPSRKELFVGTGLGFGMFAIILGSYALAGRTMIDAEVVRDRVREIGLLRPDFYLAFALYFTFVNALVEEYIWRWFAYRQCERLVPGVKAILLAAACFTLHHIFALAGFTGNLWVTISGSLGVFVAGAVWSGCYLAYRSLWAVYMSHLLADLAIALVGWHLLFGSNIPFSLK